MSDCNCHTEIIHCELTSFQGRMDKTHPDPTLATDILQCNVLPLLDIILFLMHHLLLLHLVPGGQIYAAFHLQMEHCKTDLSNWTLHGLW